MAGHTVVQVVFGKVRPGLRGGHSHTYTYQVPAGLGDFDLGAQVVVPANWACPLEQLATVVGFGRGDYNGPLAELVGVVRKPRRNRSISFVDDLPRVDTATALSKRIQRLERWAGLE